MHEKQEIRSAVFNVHTIVIIITNIFNSNIFSSSNSSGDNNGSNNVKIIKKNRT